MIIHGVTPTDDVSVVSVQQVANRLNIKRYETLLGLLRMSSKYIAYHEPNDDDNLIVDSTFKDFRYKKQRYADVLPNESARINQNYRAIYKKRLLMPLSTAWRLIKDAEAGKILVKAARI